MCLEGRIFGLFVFLKIYLIKLFAGESYEGEWENGFKHGFGVWKNNNGESYKGDWKMGKAHGKGHQVWSNGKHTNFSLENDRKMH